MKTFLDVFPTLPSNGWLTEDEAALLYWYASCTEGAILEVGCYQGRSSVLLASFNRPLYCVDPFDGFSTDLSGDEVEAAWRVNMRDREIFHAVLFRERIEDWEARLVSFAYLDGDHTYDGTLDQIAKAAECGARVIAIHDVNDSGGGLEVKRAAVETLGAWVDRVERLAVWVIK